MKHIRQYRGCTYYVGLMNDLLVIELYPNMAPRYVLLLALVGCLPGSEID